MSEVALVGPAKIEPYPGTRTRWDYYQALQTTELLAATGGELPQTIDILTGYIFSKHPDVLDLPPALLHRYRQSQNIVANYQDGQILLHESILNRFQSSGQALQEGYINMRTSTVISADPARPHPEFVGGEMTQRIKLPESIQRRSVAWNHWIQDKIQAGGLEDLISANPQWHATRLAEGSLLPIGNLNIELVEGLARARTPAHLTRAVEKQWGLPVSDEWGSGLDLWFVMSHIIEKDLLTLAASIDPEMIDGMHLTPDVYAKSYIPILELMDLNPQLAIQGVLSEGTWAYSSELARLFPEQEIAKLHHIAGRVIELGTAEELGLPEQAVFATHDPVRKQAYEQGHYGANVATRYIDRSGMLAVLRQFGLDRFSKT